MNKELQEGIKLYQEGRYEQALRIFRSKEEDLESNPIVAYYLGLTCTKLEEYEKALEYLEIVVANDFDFIYTYQSRMVIAYIYSVTQRYELSELELQSVLDEGYESPQIYSAFGHIYWQMNKPKEALKILQKALKQDPQNSNALNSVGYILADMDSYLDKALQYCESAVEMKPENPAYLDSLGWVYFRRGELKTAKKYLEEALELAPHNPTIQEHLESVIKAEEVIYD